MEFLQKISSIGGAIFKRAILITLVLYFVHLDYSGLCCPSKRACIINTASKDLGIHEVGGNNRGPEVEAILAHAGMPAGSNWCSAWVMRVLDRCNINHTVNAWSPTSTPTAKCVYQRDKGQKFKSQPGDVFSLYYSNLKRIGHTGFIEKEDGDFVITMEANTNDGGTRDSNKGDSIMRKRRSKKSIYRVANWVD